MMKKNIRHTLTTLALALVMVLCLVPSMTEQAEAVDTTDYIKVFGTKLYKGDTFTGNINGTLHYGGKSNGTHTVYLDGFQHSASGYYGIYCPGDLRILPLSETKNSISTGSSTSIRAEGSITLSNVEISSTVTNSAQISYIRWSSRRLTLTLKSNNSAGLYAAKGDIDIQGVTLDVTAYGNALYSGGDMTLRGYEHKSTVVWNGTIQDLAANDQANIKVTATGNDGKSGPALQCMGDFLRDDGGNATIVSNDSNTTARVYGKVTIDAANGRNHSNHPDDNGVFTVENKGTGDGLVCYGGMSVSVATVEPVYESEDMPISFISQAGYGLWLRSNLTNAAGEPVKAVLKHSEGCFNVVAYGSKAALYLEDTVVEQTIPIDDSNYKGQVYNEINVRNHGSGNGLETNGSVTLKVVDAETKSGSAIYVRGDLTLGGVSVLATNNSSIKSTVTVNGDLIRSPMLPADVGFWEYIDFASGPSLEVTNKSSGRALYVAGSIDTVENTYSLGEISASSNGGNAIYCVKDIYVGPHTQITGSTTMGTAVYAGGNITVYGGSNPDLSSDITKLRGESESGIGIYANGAIKVDGEEGCLSGESVNAPAIQSARSITMDGYYVQPVKERLETNLFATAVNGVGLKAPVVEFISGKAEIDSQLNAIETDKLNVNADTERDLAVIIEVTNLNKDAAYDPENYSALGGCKEFILTNADATVAPFRDGTYDGAVQLTEKNRSNTNYAYIRVGHLFVNGVGTRYGDYLYGNMTVKNTAPIHQKNGDSNYVVFTKTGFTMNNYVADNGDATLPLFETEGDMTVTLEGKNVVTSPAGLISGGKLTVKGDGSLTLNTTVGHGFQAKGDVKMESGELKITATGSALYAPTGKVEVLERANLDVTGGEYGVVADTVRVDGAMTARSTNTKLDDVYYAVESGQSVIKHHLGWRILCATTPNGTPGAFNLDKITSYDYMSVKPYEMYITNQSLPIPSQDATKYLPDKAYTCEQLYRITETKWQTADQVDFEGRFTMGEQYYACYRIESVECDVPLGYSLQFYVGGKQLYYDGVNVVVSHDETNQDGWVKVLYECCVNEVAAPKVTVSNKADTGKPYLTWGKVANAAKYEIWRCDTTDAYAYYTKMYTTTSTSYTNTSAEPNVMYYYKVRGLDADGNPGKFSDVYTCVCDCAAPVVKLELNESKQPVLTWEAVKGAVEYDVYRCSTKDGAYTKITIAPIFTNTLTDVGATAGKTYYYKVRAYGNNSNANSAYSAIVASGLEAPAPSIYNKSATGQPYLSWDKVDGAAKYEVYRSTTGKDGSFSKMMTTTGTSYTNSTAKVGTKYYYKVRAIDADGNKSEFSAVKSITCDLAQPVVTISTKASNGKPMLKWPAVEGADKYEIWRSTTGKDGSFTKMMTTSSTSYTNTTAKVGTKYYYKVKALYSANTNANSAFSAVTSITCDLAQPTGVSISIKASNGKPTMSWTKVEGADKYEIWRSTTGKDGSFTKMYTQTGTTYTNTTDAKAGTKYYYKVKAIYSANTNANSAYSAVVSITCDLAQPVVTISTKASNGKPTLKWTAVSGADKYEIWRSTTGKDGSFTKQYTTTGTSYTNTSAKAGTKYYYKVRAVYADNTNANSAYSAAVSITCDLAQPTNVTITANANGKPKITWDKVEGADKYEIWRSTTGETGSFTKQYTQTGTSYTNTTAKAGTTYYYKIRAVFSANTNANSAYSAAVSIKVK